MATEDSSFEASGPTTVAFETITDQQSVGVGVSGTTTGVFGSSSSRQGSRPPNNIRNGAPYQGIGVGGIGDAIGVYAAGSIGVMADADSVGLVAVGEKMSVLAQHNATSVSPETSAVTVEANGNRKNESGVGLHAWSSYNRAGVFATGVLQSRPTAMQMGGLVAQIHLVPIPDTAVPPTIGNAGDLIVIQHKDLRQTLVTELHFCISSSSPGVPAGWKQII